jgi:hypothetical protein
MDCRLKKELADVVFRMAQGLDRCDQFFDDRQLLTWRHSRSKSLFLFSGNVEAPLDFYFRALKSNNDAIRIDFHCNSDQDYASFAETICDLPSSVLVTSILVSDRQRLPRIQRDTPLFIYNYDDSQSLGTFLNYDQSLACTCHTYIFTERADPRTMNIAVSFIGPSSGNLILRLKHRADRPDTTLTVLGTSFALTIPESLTIDDINLHPDGNSSSQLSFMRNTRNNLILRVHGLLDYYTLPDIQLLDGDGYLYDQPSQRNIPATEFDALS